MIGWITTYGIRCGIATYSKFLIEKMEDDVIIMCQSGEGDVEGAIPCWQRDSNFFGGIIAQVAAKDIKTIVIQHQPGFMRFSYLNELLLKLHEMEVKVFITMHNTKDRSLVFPSKRIEKAVSGLKTCSNIMVHSSTDVDNLKKLGVVDNVVMIPHGIYPPPKDDVESLEVKGRVMATFGFLLPHKGQIELVEAFARLPGWDQLLLLCATRKGTGKTEKKINAIIKDNQLESKVRLVTDFLDDDVAISTLAKCELLIFPYQKTNESASGAVRMGVAAGTPIAVSPIPIFDDITGSIKMRGASVEDIVASISAITDEQMANSRNEIVKLRDAHQWETIASKIHSLLK
jgi:glycosyltransferase involved in cell wall biosynthesis